MKTTHSGKLQQHYITFVHQHRHFYDKTYSILTLCNTLTPPTPTHPQHITLHSASLQHTNSYTKTTPTTHSTVSNTTHKSLHQHTPLSLPATHTPTFYNSTNTPSLSTHFTLCLGSLHVGGGGGGNEVAAWCDTLTGGAGP